MKTTCLRAVIVVTMAGLGGCSGSEKNQVSELPTGEILAAASINPTLMRGSITSSTTESPNGATNETSNGLEPFRNPFAPPKDPPPPPITAEPEPEPEAAAPQEPIPEARQPGMPPKVRLLGFMNVGEPKVLVSFRDGLETLAVGDTLEDMEVVQIDSPNLTMLFEEREIKLSLFEQQWRQEGGSAAAGNNSHVQSRPRSTRPARPAGTPASGGVTPRAPTRGSTGIPGFAPNAGKPPGFHPAASSGAGSTPGAPIGSPPTGLPGLSSDPGGGTGIGDGGLPGIPGLTADKPGAGNLPSLPGGP